MSQPTDYDRQLWLKVAQTPMFITDSEKRHILQLAEPSIQQANALRIAGMTPLELENKALTTPELLTDAECTLMRHGYHDWDIQERVANSQMEWHVDDRMARIRAAAALRSPHDNAVKKAVALRTAGIADEADETRKIAMQKVAEKMHEPCRWVQELIDSSARWGFVVLRDARTDCSDEEWDTFLKAFDQCVDSSMLFLTGGTAIRPKRQLIWHNGFVNEDDRDSLIGAYHKTISSNNTTNEHILSNTFLLITPEVVASVMSDKPTTPHVWAIEPDFAAAKAVAEGKYDGRLKVGLFSLFTWFYAARKENIHSMDLFWEKAQQQPDQAWVVGTSMGRYHGPLVLLEKGTIWPFDTYELKTEA